LLTAAARMNNVVKIAARYLISLSPRFNPEENL
jgi:hypothetical protein